MTRTVVVMVKEPRAGRVKTRLGRDIGMTSAAWWFRHQSARLLRRIVDPRWRVVLAVSPDACAFDSRQWPASLPHQLPRRPQGTGDLGTRMRHQLGTAPPGPVCVIGADIPGLSRAALGRAFRALGSHDAVFGPAEDGGYWLIGLHNSARVPHGLFDGVRWSTEHALADTIASLPGARIALVDRLRDVDTAQDLDRA